ncbi:hypothetical protein BGX29_008274 [Mortierella sp. GBA35]|nr:hypothetical protein BGX29_008274 [Mortierella sp. GBA35]
MSGEDTTEGPYMDPSVSDSYDAPEQYTYNLSAVSLRLRPLAKSTLDPVQPLGSIPRTAQFIKLFGPALIQNTVLFLNSLLALNVSSSAASGIPVPPLADYHNALGHLQNRLGLDTVDLVEPYIQATIAFLKQQIPGGDSATPSIQLSSVDLSLVSHYTSPKDWNAPVEPSDTDMDIDSEDVPGTFLAVDSLGRRQYVCYHHYRQLYDTFEQNHVKDKTNDVGKYDVHNGKITADLGSPEELDAFCRVEPAKVGFVSEFDVAVHYDASVDERRRLNDFASSLGISTMYIFNSSSRTDDPDTFGKTPIGDKATETSYVLDLLRKTIGTLTRATFIWNSALDSTTLLDDVTRSRDKLLYLTIKSSRQQVSTVISRAHLEVRDVKSVIMDLPDTTDPATVDDSTTIHDPIRSGRAQAVTIAHGETSEEDKAKPKLESCKSKISSVFRSNKGLTSLTLECKAKWLDMKGLMKAVKEVVSQTSDPLRLPLRRVVLKDNTDNDMTALFDLSQDSQDPFAVPIHLDVTERSESSTMSTVLKNCSGAIRVLNLIGLTTGCPNLLADLLYRKAESIPLVSLMLTLDEIRIQHESMLSKVLALSKDTFKQLTLVAQPQLQDATAGLLRILGELRDCRILVTRTRTSGVETWIDQVRRNVHGSSTLIIVESAEELQLMVPELTAPIPYPTDLSSLLVSGSDPSIFRSVRTKTSDTFDQQVVFLADIEATFDTTNRIERDGQVVDFLSDPLDPLQLIQPHQILAQPNAVLHVVLSPADSVADLDRAGINLPAPPLSLLYPLPFGDLFYASVASACLKVPSLTYPSIEFVESYLPMPRLFIVLPIREGSALPIEKSSFKLFNLCVCDANKPVAERWMPHLINEYHKTVDKKHATWFIDLFGPVLHSNTELFLRTLRESKGISSNDPTALTNAPLADYNQTIKHLVRELHLSSNDQVEGYLQATIYFLKDRITPRFKSDTTFKQWRLKRSDITLLSSFLTSEDTFDTMAIDSEGAPGAYLTIDSLDRDKFVCYHHYRQLYTTFEQNYVEDKTGGIGQYDTYSGKITANLKSSKDLATLCSIEPARVGFVSEVDVSVCYNASTEDRRGLHDFAASLGITTITISDSNGTGNLGTSGRSVLDATKHVQQLLRGTTGNLKQVNIIWSPELDVSTLLQDVSRTRRDFLYLSIKTSRQEVSSVMFNGQLDILHVKSKLDGLSYKTEGVSLAEKAQSLAISTSRIWNDETKDAITSAIKRNSVLSTLTLDCKPNAKDFKVTVASVKKITSQLNAEQDFRLPLRYLVLKDNTDNDVTALFDLSKEPEGPFLKPVVMDITARSDSVTISSLLKNYGGSIRVLNLIGLSLGCPNHLGDLFHPKPKPNRLVGLMLTLDHLREQHLDTLSEVLALSKETFKQLVLVAQPQLKNAREKLLDMLEYLHHCQVVVTRTKAPGTEMWIEKVQREIHESSTLVVVDSAEELRLMVPELSAEGIKFWESFDQSSQAIKHAVLDDEDDGDDYPANDDDDMWEGDFYASYDDIEDDKATDDMDVRSTFAKAPFKLFRMCVCGPNDSDEHFWAPHLLNEPRPDVENPSQFIDLFASVLLANAKLFLSSLPEPQESTSAASSLLPTFSYADCHQVIEHIQEELDLSSVDVVEPLLEKVIEHLQQLLSPRRSVVPSEESFVSGYTPPERSHLSQNDVALLLTYMEMHRPDTPSAYLNFDMDGNDVWVCHSHYRVLDPTFRQNHIKRTIKYFGAYGASSGRIDACLRTPRDLAALCRIDFIKAGFITELNISSSWTLSPEELRKLVECAGRLDLTTLSMTGTNDETGPSSSAPLSSSSRGAETTYVKNLLSHAPADLTRATLSWGSDLDIPAIIQDTAKSRQERLHLAIKTADQEVSSVMFKGHLGTTNKQ